jgi:hypothetical protein
MSARIATYEVFTLSCNIVVHVIKCYSKEC